MPKYRKRKELESYKLELFILHKEKLFVKRKIIEILLLSTSDQSRSMGLENRCPSNVKDLEEVCS